VKNDSFAKKVVFLT